MIGGGFAEDGTPMASSVSQNKIDMVIYSP
jgi:hypothetical protein